MKIGHIADLQWEHRIILGVVESEVGLKSSVNTLEAHEEDVADRKIAYFITNGDVRHTNYRGALDEKIWQEVAQILSKTDDQFALIGLDGGVKARYEALDVSQIFSLIDTMPMRQQEMRRSGNN